MTAMTPDRRTVLAALAAGAALGPALASAKEKPFKGLIIDALGGVGDPNPAPDEDPAGDPFALGEEALSERGVNDAIASGLTAFNLTLGYVAGDAEPFEHTVRDIAQWDALIRGAPDKLIKVYTADDILEARKSNRVGVIYGFQNALALGSDPSRAKTFAGLGVKIIQLTYNNCYPIGCGASMPADKDTGLTDFGREAVSALEEARVLVDLSPRLACACCGGFAISPSSRAAATSTAPSPTVRCRSSMSTSAASTAWTSVTSTPSR